MAKAIIRNALACSLVALVVVFGAGGRSQAVGPGAPNQARLDADPAIAGEQDSRYILGSDEFTVAVAITEIEGPYQGYHWAVEFPSAGLAYSVGSGVEESAATGLDLCAHYEHVFPGSVDPVNNTRVDLGGCIGLETTTFIGRTSSFELRCLSDGIFDILMLDMVSGAPDGGDKFASTLFATGGKVMDTGTQGITIGCFLNTSNDHDSDGCSTAEEFGADPALGGDRDPMSEWDFFDVPVPALQPGNISGVRNGHVTIADVLAVQYYTGTVDGGAPNVNGVDYDTDLNNNGVEDGREYDRSPSSDSSKPWRSGPPNGSVTSQDVLVANSQSSHSCAAAP